MKDNIKRETSCPLWIAIIVGIIFLGWINSFDQALISTLASKNASAISFAQHFTVLANTKVMVVLTTLAAIIFWLCKQHNAA